MEAPKNQKAVLECDLQERCLQALRAQERKVNVVKALRKPYEELQVDEVKVLVMWNRQAKQDLPVPTTKPLLLACLRKICDCGDRDPPPLPDTRPIETETEALDVDDTTAVWALESRHSGSSPLDPLEEDTQFQLMKRTLLQS